MFAASSVIVILVPLPFTAVVAGFELIDQFPAAGNPFKTTEPSGNKHVG